MKFVNSVVEFCNCKVESDNSTIEFGNWEVDFCNPLVEFDNMIGYNKMDMYLLELEDKLCNVRVF